VAAAVAPVAAARPPAAAGEAERAALLQRTLDASDRERRRIAQHLHDGAVQHFTGVGYQLAAAAEELPEQDAAPLRDAAAETRLGVRELRSLLVDIYPADLRSVGLATAIDRLAAPLRQAGVEVDTDVPDDLSLRPEVEALFFRVTQEALRNVEDHAGATHVDVCVRDDGAVELVVTDDGKGFDVRRRRAEGHFGLRLIEDAAADVGGTAVVSSEPGSGTRVRVEVPHTEAE
jgi:two-component system NarL family sensor kinase